jgi:hypothetical protein
MKVQLIVYRQNDNVPIDLELYENESISLNFSFTDIKSLESKNTFSRTFRIPTTANNNSVFGIADNVNFQFNTFNPKRKLKAEIRVEGIPILSGTLQFKAVYKKMDIRSDYEVVFFGNIVEFFKGIGDKGFFDYIAECLETDYAHIVSWDNIKAINNDAMYGDQKLYYSLTDRGNNWVGTNESGTRWIYENDISKSIKPAELTLFVSAEYIFLKALELSGYTTYAGLSLTLLSRLSTMYIPWINESSNVTQLKGGTEDLAKIDYTGFPANVNVPANSFTSVVLGDGSTLYYMPIPDMDMVYDPSGYVTTGNVFTAPFSGRYRIKASLMLSIDNDPWYDATGSVQFRVGLLQDTGSSKKVYANSNFIDWYYYDYGADADYFDTNPKLSFGTNSWNGSYENDNYIGQGDTMIPILIIQGDGVTEYLTNTTATLTFHSSDNTTGNTYYTSMKCDQVSKALFGTDIDFYANAPKMKLKEFLTDLQKMFNLVFMPNPNNPKTLIFMPMMEYLESGDFKDWTDKIDYTKDLTLLPTTDLQAKKNTWTYKANNDYLNNFYTTQGERVYGRLELLDPENDFATGETKIELSFSATPLALISGTEVPIAKFINENAEYVGGGTRILYRTTTSHAIKLYKDSTNSVDNCYIPLFSHYTQINPDLGSFDLNFGQEVPLHPITNYPWRTLYALYWNDYIREIYSPDSRIMEAYFQLNIADIFAFKYNDIVWIKDAYWRILEINDYVVGTQGETKVKLLKITTANPTTIICTNYPASISLTGFVNFEDSNGNPQPASELCCTKYNYYWDGNTANCYAFVKPDKPTTGHPTTGGKPVDIKDVTAVSKKALFSSSTSGRDTLLSNNTNIIKSGATDTIVNSRDSEIGANNSNAIITGAEHIVRDDLGSVVVDGKTADVINVGQTTGANGEYAGEMQGGKMMLSCKATLVTALTTIDVLADGFSNIKIPDDCVWSVRLQITLAIVSGGITETLSGEYAMSWQSVAGSCTEIGLNVLSEITTYSGMTINFFNSSPASGLMSIRISVAGCPSYPCDVVVVGTLNYTQYSYV